jgi:Ca-activated chloride channel family protein
MIVFLVNPLKDNTNRNALVRRWIMRTRTIVFLTVLTSLSFCLSLAFATSTGQIKGRLTHKDTGKPIIGASVLVVGTTMGAMTDLEGKFQILRLEPGTYILRISHLEFVTLEITDVVVGVDSTVEINRTLISKVTDLDETITVTGSCDALDKFVVDSRVTITRRPVQTVDNLLTQVAGVRTTSEDEVFIRGGRAGEVSYIVDGVPIGDPLGGSPGNLSLVSGSIAPPAHGGSAIVNGEPFDAMFFEHYGVNPFVDTEDDHYSTFAIDIDDASYTLARAYLNRGQLPHKDAIRVEEFINHFEYNYDPPDREAFRVVMEAAPSHFGPQGSQLLRIGIKGKVIRDADRKPANLVFVIDVSGSMGRENRLGLVKKSLALLTDRLTARDRVGIVIYGSRATVKMNPTWCHEKRNIQRVIESVQCGGSTNAEHGIKLGYKMASEIFVRGHINRVILCSDGVANVGATDSDGIHKQIKQYAQKGITLTTIGFGMGNYNDVLMEKLANNGDGQYAYVDNLKEARRLLIDNLTGTLQEIARDVKIQVDFNPGVVRSYRLLGYENRDVDDDKFRDDTEDGGEIGAGHTATALYELKLTEQPTSDVVATVFIRYQDPDSGEITEINHPFRRGGFTGTFAATSDDFRLAAAVAEFSEIMRGSYWARDAKLAPVLEVVQRLMDRSDNEDIVELERLIMTAGRHAEELAKR